MSAPTVLLGGPKSRKSMGSWIVAHRFFTLSARRRVLNFVPYRTHDTRTDPRTIGRYGAALRPAMLHFQHSCEFGLSA
jgi:hypothetical protein